MAVRSGLPQKPESVSVCGGKAPCSLCWYEAFQEYYNPHCSWGKREAEEFRDAVPMIWRDLGAILPQIPVSFSLWWQELRD